MSKHESHINWTAFAVWGIWPTAWLAVIVTILLLTCSCASTKTTTEHHQHTVVADTLAQQAQVDGHALNEIARLDSLMAMLLQHDREQGSSTEDSRETITETITTSIDSLGRELRTEQRTTERTLSRQEQWEREQWQQQMMQWCLHELSIRDSAWQARFDNLHTHWQEQSADDSQTVKEAPQSASWWQRTKSWVGGVVIGAILVIGFWLTRKWWLALLKR